MTLVRKFLATALATLLLTGAVAPALAAGETKYAQSSPGFERPTWADQSVSSPQAPQAHPQPIIQTPPDNLSSLELRAVAYERLNATLDQGPGDQHDRLLSSLNRTFDGYIAGNRTTAPPFKTDQQVLAQTINSPPNIEEWLVASDARLATTAIEDAERVFDYLQTENVSFDEAAVTRHLRQARHAYQQGQDVADRNPAGAIPHYRKAWGDAQTALDIMDAAVTPNVTLATRSDPPHNGSFSYPIRGEVFDVRPYEITNVTISINNDSTRTVSVAHRNTSPVSAGRFATTVELNESINTITITATDPTDQWGDRVAQTDTPTQSPGNPGSDTGGGKHTGGANGKSDHPDNGNPPTSATDAPSDSSDDQRRHDNSVGRAHLLLDGDWLSDQYETTTTLTDPLHPDSTSARTDRNESGNGRIDGLEDFDNDTLATYREYLRGTDPFAIDTDNDTLPDFAEIIYEELDPTAADSDGDGTLDRVEDPDNDSLGVAEELNLGTNPFKNDTDRDGLSDDLERESGTDPVAADTDGDGLEDATELRLGTDPTLADTDGDGIEDGNETFTTAASNDSLGVAVSITGEGDVASTATIENGSRKSFETGPAEDARVTPIVHLDTERAFSNATVEFSYNESAVGNESDLAVYHFNKTLRTFVRMNSTVDATNNTVSTTTPHFSRFAVFNVTNWESSFTAKSPQPTVDLDNESSDEITPVDVVFVIDSSGSMRWNDPNEFRKEAARRFVGALLGGDRAGVVDFDWRSSVAQPLTKNFTAVNITIDDLDASGGTNIGRGVRTANSHFDTTSTDSRAKVAILLTDGQGPGGIEEAKAAAQQNITYHTIGFGYPNTEKLERIASITNGSFTFVESASDLPNVFSRIASNTTGLEDSDDDGLFDVIEERGPTDPTDPDTDGDGLDDGLEVRGFQTNLGWITTDPINNDTDGDGLTDAAEIAERLDSGGPNSVSGPYYFLSSDPREVHSDRDTLDDFEEARTRTINITTSPTRTREFAKAQADPDSTPTSGSQFLVDVELLTTGDAFEPDTDFDGLTDDREVTLGSNPLDADTDGDGIDDDRELAVNASPVLFDATAPETAVKSLEIDEMCTIDTDAWELDCDGNPAYVVSYEVTDPAGIQVIELRKSGVTEQSEHPDGTHWETTDQRLPFSFGENLEDAFLGATITIYACDDHGNCAARQFSNPNVLADAAAFIHDHTGADIHDVYAGLGVASGLAYGIGETGTGLYEIIKQPTKIIEGFSQLIDAAREHGPALAGMIVDAVERSQNHQNPFDTGAMANYSFASGWYMGYVGVFVLEEIAVSKGAGIGAKAARLSNRISTAMDAVGGARVVAKVKVRGTARRASIGTLRHTKQALPDGFDMRRVASELRTIGAPRISTVTRALDDVEGLQQLRSAVGESRVVSYVSRYGRSGTALLNQLSSTAKQRLVALQQHRRFQRQLVGAWRHDPDMTASDIGHAVRRHERLDTWDQAAYRHLIDHSGSRGLRTTRELTDGELQDLLGTDDIDSVDEFLETRSEITTFVQRTGPDGVSLVRSLDEQRLQTLLRFADPVPADGGPIDDVTKAFVRKLVKIEDPDFPNNRFVDELDEMTPTARKNFMEDVVAERIPLDTLKHQYDELLSIRRTNGKTFYRTTIEGADSKDLVVNARFYENGDRFVDDLLQTREATLESILNNDNSDLFDRYMSAKSDPNVDAQKWLFDNIYTASNPSMVRGAIGEEIIQPAVLRRSETEFDLSEGSIYDEFQQTLDSGVSQTGQQGLDGIVETDGGRLVLIETKVKDPSASSNPKQVTPEYLGDRDIGKQFSDEWIEEKFESMARNAEDAANHPTNPSREELQFLQRLDSEGYIHLEVIENDDGTVSVLFNGVTDNVDRRLIAVQDGPVNGYLSKSNLRGEVDGSTLSIDHVDIVKIGDVFTTHPDPSKSIVIPSKRPKMGTNYGRTQSPQTLSG